MNVATFDKSRILELSARIGESAVPLTLTFKDSTGSDYDITGKDFEFVLRRRPSDRNPIWTLTESSGLTVIGTNQLKIEITADQATQKVDTYFWRLYSSDEDHTWLNGYFRFHNGEFELDEDQQEDIIIYENGAEITITINEGGSSSGWSFLGYWDASTNLFPVNPSRNGYYKASSDSTSLVGIGSQGVYTAGMNINYIGDDPTDIYSWDAIYASDNHPVIPEIDTLEINP